MFLERNSMNLFYSSSFLIIIVRLIFSEISWNSPYKIKRRDNPEINSLKRNNFLAKLKNRYSNSIRKISLSFDGNVSSCIESSMERRPWIAFDLEKMLYLMKVSISGIVSFYIFANIKDSIQSDTFR